MKVYGVEITEEQQAAALAVMQGVFTTSNVRGALVRAGVPITPGLSDRAADRILQRERKAGNILAMGRNWHSCSDNDTHP